MTRLALVLVLLLAGPAVAATPGARDRSFGDRGVARADRIEAAAAIRVEPSGHLLVAGGSKTPGVARLTARGRPDRTFASRGVFARRALGPSLVTGVRRDRERRVQLGLTTLGLDGPALRMLQLSAGGRAFGVRAFPDFFPGPITRAAQRTDGGAFVATRDGLLRAFRPDATLDPAFGTGGAARICPPDAPHGCHVAAMAPTADGGAVLGSQWGTAYRVARYDPRGVIRWSLAVEGPVEALHVTRSGAVIGALSVTRRQLARISADGTRIRRSTLPEAPGRLWDGVQAITTDARGRIYVLQNVLFARRERTRTRSRVLRLSAAGRAHRGYEARIPVARGNYSTNLGTTLALDRRGGLLVGGAHFVGGDHDPVGGCGIRDDMCATDVRLRVWRFRR